MEIGKKIQQTAKEKKISAIELANKIGKSRQAVYDIYNGKVSVNIELLARIALVLGVPMVYFFKDPDKPLVDRQALREIIVEILYEVLTRYYVHYTDIQRLSKEIHEYAIHGKGLVHLRVKREDAGVEIVTDYRELKTVLNEQEVSGYGQALFDDFFNNMGPLGDRLEIKKLINNFFDEKGSGYLMKVLT